MYKVMIVDDEPAIREGMTTLIEWETYGFTVCGTAANGREALAKAEELLPDLMLVDIRMPGMSGLELIERIREKNDQCHFLILSGYSDFEYARRAIGFRVDGYMLKPVNEDELCENLERIQESLIAEKEAQRQHDEDVAWRAEQLVKSIVSGSAGDGLTDELWQPIAVRLSIEWPGYKVALAEVEPGEDSDPGKMNLIKRRWSKELQAGNRGFVFLMEPYIGILLRQEAGVSLTDAELLRLLLANGYSDHIFVSVGRTVTSFQNATLSYDSAIAGLRHRFVLGTGVIVNADEETAMNQEQADELPIDDLAEHLFYAMDIGNKESAVRTIEAAAQRMTELRFTEEMRSRILPICCLLPSISLPQPIREISRQRSHSRQRSRTSSGRRA
ncbi:response regulator [Paenibacillus kobensis]|uniref:response regulator n=1 Tax=Paenibacillus kobensis TaxID=59841 RepID=UPI000FDCAD05|nr:response regulator [Paenibacillus kobensis]